MKRYERKSLKTGDVFSYRGNKIKLRAPKKIKLNKLQEQHLNGELDIYQPIEAYSEQWKTITKKQGYWEDYVSAAPVPNTRKRSDLPSINQQWRDAKVNGRTKQKVKQRVLPIGYGNTA